MNEIFALLFKSFLIHYKDTLIGASTAVLQNQSPGEQSSRQIYSNKSLRCYITETPQILSFFSVKEIHNPIALMRIEKKYDKTVLHTLVKQVIFNIKSNKIPVNTCNTSPCIFFQAKDYI